MPRKQPIPADKGLALALRNHDKRGVFIIQDVAEAAKGPYWIGSKNDQLPDVKTLMVAPINGYEDGQKVMFGILYVTSESYKFCPGHTLPMKAIADYLGLIYPLVIDRQGGPG